MISRSTALRSSLNYVTDPSSPSCVVTHADGQSITYQCNLQKDFLGNGSFGAVYAFHSNQAHTIVVKLCHFKFQGIIGNYTIEDWEQKTNDSYQKHVEASRLEAYCNQAYGGFGCVDTSAKPRYTVAETYDEIKGIRLRTIAAEFDFYIAMSYVAGVELGHFRVSSGELLLKIIIAILKELQVFHTMFIHGDLKGDNIKIYQTNSGDITIKFIDFTFSRPLNTPVLTLGRKASLQPPEFSQYSVIPCEKSHDIYSLSNNVFIHYFNSLYKHFSPEVAWLMGMLVHKMRNSNPHLRPTTEFLIDSFSALENDNVKSQALFVAETAQLLQNIDASRAAEYIKLTACHWEEVRENFIATLSSFDELFKLLDMMDETVALLFMQFIAHEKLALLCDFPINDMGAANDFLDFLKKAHVPSAMIDTLLLKLARQAILHEPLQAPDYWDLIRIRISEAEAANYLRETVVHHYRRFADFKLASDKLEEFSGNKAFFNRALYLAIDVYCEQRCQQSAYKSWFSSSLFAHNKSQKLFAAQQLKEAISTNCAVPNLSALQDGNLGHLAMLIQMHINIEHSRSAYRQLSANKY